MSAAGSSDRVSPSAAAAVGVAPTSWRVPGSSVAVNRGEVYYTAPFRTSRWVSPSTRDSMLPSSKNMNALFFSSSKSPRSR